MATDNIDVIESALSSFEKEENKERAMQEFFKDYKQKMKEQKVSERDVLEAIVKKHPEQKDLLSAVYKRLPNPHIKSWEEYKQSIINFDESKDYKSGIFNRRFPIGTISYIGARPARGKTTMLVNVALDAIRQGKNAIYITAEETTKQILTRFILCTAYEKNVKEGLAGDYIKTLMRSESNTRTAFYTYMKSRASTLDGMEATNEKQYESATETIKKLLQDGKLTVFEAYGATYADLINYLALQEAGSVILIDYIQHLKAPERLVTQTRQIQIQEMSHTLADIAGQAGLIMISGAQFSRPAKGGGNSGDVTQKKADTFDESSFREAGDIEQDGHILIGLGKDPQTDTFYYSCMKDREATPDNGSLWSLEKDLAYSYMRAEKNEKGEPLPYSKTEKGQGNNSGSNGNSNEFEGFSYGKNREGK